MQQNDVSWKEYNGIFEDEDAEIFLRPTDAKRTLKRPNIYKRRKRKTFK